MGWWIFGAGVALLLLSGSLTRRFLKKRRVHIELLDEVAGSGVVPRWVSLINLVSWPVIAIGLLMLLSSCGR